MSEIIKLTFVGIVASVPLWLAIAVLYRIVADIVTDVNFKEHLKYLKDLLIFRRI